MDIYAVTGNPVLHSLSPVLMNAAFASAQTNAVYLKLCADTVSEVLEMVYRLNIKGLNITAPFKNEMFQVLEQQSTESCQVEAVNCYYKTDNGYVGTNTDIAGVAQSIAAFLPGLAMKKAVIIGSGGAAPAVIAALQKFNIPVLVAARNANALQNLKLKFGVDTCTLPEIESKEYDILVSTLPAANDVIKTTWLRKDLLVFDANYKNSVLEDYSKTFGFMFISGKQWLLNQAVPSFKHFTGIDIQPSDFLHALNNVQPLTHTRIALIGFMGCGKSSVGKLLAEKLNFTHIDTDTEIEKSENSSITEIFNKRGEPYFRTLENTCIRSLEQSDHIVVSFGGGAVMHPENRTYILQHFLCFWLDGSPDYCLQGLDISNRPVLQTDDSLQKAAALHAQRQPFYAQSAHAVLNIENKSFQQITEKIYGEIHQTFGL